MEFLKINNEPEFGISYISELDIKYTGIDINFEITPILLKPKYSNNEKGQDEILQIRWQYDVKQGNEWLYKIQISSNYKIKKTNPKVNDEKLFKIINEVLKCLIDKLIDQKKYSYIVNSFPIPKLDSKYESDIVNKFFNSSLDYLKIHSKEKETTQ